MRYGKRFWFAGAAAGTVVAAIAAPASAQDINETVNGPSSGVVAAGAGTQNVTVTITKKGDVENPSGVAVTATAQQGAVRVTDNGSVAGSAGGILGQTAGPNVSITVNQGVAGGAGNAVEAIAQTNGAASVAVGDGQNANHPLTITTTGPVGAGAVSVFGNAAIQVGGNVSISAGSPGEAGAVDVLALGVLTPADTAGPSAVATIGRNATLNLQGNNSAAVAAQIGLSGQEGPNGSASTAITIGNGVNINVHGFNNAGVIGFVEDLKQFHLYAGTGDVSISVGTGTINVDEVGGVGFPTGIFVNLGEGAFSAGGDVSISNAANIKVSGGLDFAIGIDATTTGAGAVSITNSGDVSSANGYAVNAASGAGPIALNLTSGNLSASSIGVNATSASGDIAITTAPSVAINAGGAGVNAVTGGSGSVSVLSGGAISSTNGDGIDASTGSGALAVGVTGDIGALGAGVNATSASGAIAIGTGKSTSIVAGGVGIQAQSAGPIVVVDEGSVSAGGDGVLAQSNGGSVGVAIGGNVSTAHGADAVEGFASGPGSATVVVGSGAHGHPLTITGGLSGGVVGVSLTGTASVSAGDYVSISAGAPGATRVTDIGAIGVLTAANQGGLGVSVDVGQNTNLTLAGDQAAGVTAQIGQAGLIGPAGGTASATASVGDGAAIHVSGLDDAGVIAFVTDISPIPHYFGSGDASVTVGTGAIVVDEAGAIGTPPGSATNIGEGAFSAGGNVSISNAANVTVSGGQDASIGLNAVTAGAGSSTITSSGDVSSANGDAVNAVSGGGPVSVSLTGGNIEARSVGVFATSDSGDVDVTTAPSVTIAAGGGGIGAITGGAGSVSVTSGGAIVSTGADGIVARSSSGAVTVSVAADIGAVFDGVNATSTSGSIDVTVAKSSSIIAGMAGVDAFDTSGAVFVDDEGTVVAGGNGVVGTSFSGPVSVKVGGNVVGGGGLAAVAGTSSGSNATVMIGSGALGHPLTISSDGIGVLSESVFATANLDVGDNVRVTAGAPGVTRLADLAATGLLTPSGLGASIVVGRNASLTLAGNASAAVAAQIGQGGVQGPIGTASVAVNVGDGVSINVSGLDNAGVFATATDITPSPRFFGSGNASITVGTGLINVNETGAIGPAPGFATNIGEGAFSIGGAVSVANAADISVIGQIDATHGIETLTVGNGTSTISTSGNITVNHGNGVWARTQNGANTIDITGGAISASGAGVLALTSGSGAVRIDNAGKINGGVGVEAQSLGLSTITNEAAGQIVGQGGAGTGAIEILGSGAGVIDNRGFVGTQAADHSGQIIAKAASGLSITNEFGGVLDGVLSTGGNVTLDNAGLWRTAGGSDFGAAGGNVLNNTGWIQVGQDFGGAPSAASFANLGAFNNGSASATGVVSMVNGHVGDSLTVSGLFAGATGHSLLALDVQLGGPGSIADELILQGGSAGQTLIRLNDVLHGPGALNPGGIVLVQGSSAASTFALDPHQPGYDPATQGIDKGLFTYPLVFTGGNEVLVGEPGLTAHQMATFGSAAEDIWSSTDPGDQSEQHLAFSLANGDDEAGGGLRVWAQALNGGPSRLNGGHTLMGRAAFASDPIAEANAGAPLSGLSQQTSSFSAYGMSYGFNTGYAQAVSALITGVDLAHHVGERDAWSWGVSTGYLESQQSFTAGSSLAQFQGALAAVHGAYVTANGFHVAGDVKMTALQLNYSTAWGGGEANAPNVAIDTFGGEAAVGWTRPLGRGWTLDPVASLSMQTSKLGSLAIQGVDVRFGDASSVRLGFGARLNGGGRIFGLTWKSQSLLQLWDELRGANTLALVGAGAGQVLPDPIGGTFTDASEQLSLASPDGRASAFVSGAYRWKSDYQAAQLSMGVKLAW